MVASGNINSDDNSATASRFGTLTIPAREKSPRKRRFGSYSKIAPLVLVPFVNENNGFSYLDEILQPGIVSSY